MDLVTSSGHAGVTPPTLGELRRSRPMRYSYTALLTEAYAEFPRRRSRSGTLMQDEIAQRFQTHGRRRGSAKASHGTQHGTHSQ